MIKDISLATFDDVGIEAFMAYKFYGHWFVSIKIMGAVRYGEGDTIIEAIKDALEDEVIQ